LLIAIRDRSQSSPQEGFLDDWGSRERVLQFFERLDTGNGEKNQTDFREQKPGNGDNHYNFVSRPPLRTSATKWRLPQGRDTLIEVRNIRRTRELDFLR
jgi:hypothetical protein